MEGIDWVAVGCRMGTGDSDGKGIADGAGAVIAGAQADRAQAKHNNELANQILFLLFIFT
jgi:hypothetical protein